ncbi:MAG: helicase-related protein [Methylococcales bacterium]
MNAIGHLKTFGPTTLSELPFLLPSGWEDLTVVVTDFKKSFPGGQRVVIRGTSAKNPSTFSTRFKAVRMAGAITDSNGIHLAISAFGNTRDLQRALEAGNRVTLTGKLELYNNAIQLTSPEVVEAQWCGKWRPKYPGKPGYLKASTVRDTVAKHLSEQIPLAAQRLRKRISLNETNILKALESPAATLEELLQIAHLLQREKAFPSRVRMGHSKLDDEDKRQAVEDVDQGRADVLIATTAIEVGVNIRKLNRAVVIDTEKFGLVSLHQIRGRVPRQGGTGYFDLLYNETKTRDVAERLNVLVNHSDGLSIASEDLRLRGSGNLASNGTEPSCHSECFL